MASFLERLKGLFKEKESAQDVVHELTKSYKKRKEMGLKDPIDTTVDKIMELIYASQDPNGAAERILKAAIEEEQMPNRVAEKVSIKISQADDLRDDVISSAFEGSQVDVPDKVINAVIEEGDLAIDSRLRLMRNVTDEAIVEARILQEFDELYGEVASLNDFKIVNRIDKIKDIVQSSDSDMDLVPHVERIFAKKIAENYYNDAIRGTKLFAFSQHIPFVKMFADDMPSQVEMEFEQIELERGEKPGRFNKEILRKQILDEIGKAIGTHYKNNREPGKRFIVPRSKMMETLSEDEMKGFLHTISIYSEKELTKKDVRQITEQVQGRITNNGTRASLIVAAMEKMQDKDESVKRVTDIMTDPTKLETLFLMEELGLLDRFVAMSPERRQKSLGIIAETLASRTRQVQQVKQDETKTEPKVQEQDVKKDESGDSKKVENPNDDGR